MSALHTPVPHTLRCLLAEARRAGRPFPDAWPEAVTAALACAEQRVDRDEWRQALNGTRDAWQASYVNGTRDAWQASYELQPAPKPVLAAFQLAA
jgi:hypothetical protein